MLLKKYNQLKTDIKKIKHIPLSTKRVNAGKA